MENLIFPVLCLIAGGYFLLRNISLMNNEEKLKTYVATSPKASRWVRKYGPEQTAEMMKRQFLPFGIIVASAAIGVGIWSLWKLLPYITSITGF